jgi:hypothetical protein
MIKKTITYKNFENEEVTEDFWFHIDEGDIIEIELSAKGGYSELLKIAQENEDSTIVGDAFKKILLGGVGRREGARFVKDDEARSALRWSGAYSKLLVWMLTNPIEAGEFVNGMLPAEAQTALKDTQAELIEKMRAKNAAMIEQVTVKDVSLDTEASVFPVEPPQVIELSAETVAQADAMVAEENVEAPIAVESATAKTEFPPVEEPKLLAADFASMTEEEFLAWKQQNG